ncbi:MAG TPA: glycerol-3-phosphate acyltransferase [Anaerolineaceae bacterium]|nr:glycerol-3-phosphate acyltransferase [Anaerolineaceae bacterium]
MNSTQWIMYAGFAFLCGAIPFSVWLGKLFQGVDIRQYGDRNPGATNVYRAGNRHLALLVLLMDVSKAAAPVGIAYHSLGIRGAPMAVIAIAPILGHVFSPFLKFHGGKGLATALGVWIGLTIWKASSVAIVSVAFGLLVMMTPGWAIVIGLAGLFVAIMIWLPDPFLFTTWIGETIILLWTHRQDLQQPPQFRSWINHLFSTEQEGQ